MPPIPVPALNQRGRQGGSDIFGMMLRVAQERRARQDLERKWEHDQATAANAERRAELVAQQNAEAHRKNLDLTEQAMRTARVAAVPDVYGAANRGQPGLAKLRMGAIGGEFNEVPNSIPMPEEIPDLPTAHDRVADVIAQGNQQDQMRVRAEANDRQRMLEAQAGPMADRTLMAGGLVSPFADDSQQDPWAPDAPPDTVAQNGDPRSFRGRRLGEPRASRLAPGGPPQSLLRQAMMTAEQATGGGPRLPVGDVPHYDPRAADVPLQDPFPDQGPYPSREIVRDATGRGVHLGPPIEAPDPTAIAPVGPNDQPSELDYEINQGNPFYASRDTEGPMPAEQARAAKGRKPDDLKSMFRGTADAALARAGRLNAPLASPEMETARLTNQADRAERPALEAKHTRDVADYNAEVAKREQNKEYDITLPGQDPVRVSSSEIRASAAGQNKLDADELRTAWTGISKDPIMSQFTEILTASVSGGAMKKPEAEKELRLWYESYSKGQEGEKNRANQLERAKIIAAGMAKSRPDFGRGADRQDLQFIDQKMERFQKRNKLPENMDEWRRISNQSAALQSPNVYNQREAVYTLARKMAGPGVLTQDDKDQTVGKVRGLAGNFGDMLAAAAQGNLSDEQVRLMAQLMSRQIRQVDSRIGTTRKQFEAEFNIPEFSAYGSYVDSNRRSLFGATGVDEAPASVPESGAALGTPGSRATRKPSPGKKRTISEDRNKTGDVAAIDGLP